MYIRFLGTNTYGMDQLILDLEDLDVIFKADQEIDAEIKVVLINQTKYVIQGFDIVRSSTHAKVVHVYELVDNAMPKVTWQEHDNNIYRCKVDDVVLCVLWPFHIDGNGWHIRPDNGMDSFNIGEMHILQAKRECLLKISAWYLEYADCLHNAATFNI